MGGPAVCMGGLLHLFDFNQSRMARKVLAHKRHFGGTYYCLTYLICGEKGAIFRNNMWLPGCDTCY